MNLITSSEYQVMIDLETASDHSNAVILSIGACMFSYDEGIVDKFYRNVSPQGQKELGLHVSPRTVEWWKTQSKEAREHLLVNPVPLKQALDEFAEWFGNKSKVTWSKGASFDQPILDSAYRAIYGESARSPWKYYDGLCFRTIDKFFPMPPENREGISHNAMDDAITQAKQLLKFFEETKWFE